MSPINDETMKLDRLPMKIEYNGYIWGCDYLRSTFIAQTEIVYTKLEKVRVTPTMQALVEHLATGRWVKYTSNVGCKWFYRILPSSGELVRCTDPLVDQWEHANHLGRDAYNACNFSLDVSIGDL